jgi:hypothetical protein
VQNSSERLALKKDIWIAGLPNKCEIILAGQSYTN